ncbi:hypothetical protein J5N97_026260 [Dioscorea zingiberensis]|uniref:non-specific serine/threonine protein kinase n=1 Tax=Dioscorea zingiberensis TaxID=325984 RepID=A0A9D5C1U4_9LILI|nr:hypothetical protein J5N97_026260 [Dioscorea zingiberensis]
MGDGEEINERRETKRMELDFDNLRALRVLGRGAMGTVFLVADAEPFALKVYDKRSPTARRPDAERRARWELTVLSRLRHPLLPTLLGSVETPDFIAWAIPFYPGGDLNALRHSLPDRSLSTAALRFYLSELVSALAHLHSLNIAFRDLKPENVLLRADGHIVLSDFDLSRQLSPAPLQHFVEHLADLRSGHPPSRPRHRRHLTRIWFPGRGLAAGVKKTRSARVSPARAGERANSFVGTEEYVAPEIVRAEGHDFAVDWWALGILAYEMAYGRTPFKGRNRKETFRNVLARDPEFPGGSARRRRTDLEDLIARLLEKDPAQRLGAGGGAGEVRAHSFFKGVQWDLVTEVSRPPFLFEDETEAVIGPGGDQTGLETFDVRDYFTKLRQETVTALSVSLDEF